MNIHHSYLVISSLIWRELGSQLRMLCHLTLFLSLPIPSESKGSLFPLNFPEKQTISHSRNTHGSSHLQPQNPNLHIPKTTDSPPHQSQPLSHLFPLPKLIFLPTQLRYHRRRFRRNHNLPPAQTPSLQARPLSAPSQRSQKRCRPHRRSQLNPLPVCFLAIVALGAIASTCNPLYTIPELSKQVQACNPKLVITVPELWHKIEELNLSSIIIGSSKSTSFAETPSSKIWHYSELNW